MTGDLKLNLEQLEKELEKMTKDHLLTISKLCKKIKINESTFYKIRQKGIASKKTIGKLLKGNFTREILQSD